MFGNDMLEESKVAFKKGDPIRSRYNGRTGKILDISVDQIHAIVRWDTGAEQKVTTGQLIKYQEERFKSAVDSRLLSALDNSLRIVIGDQGVDAVAPQEIDPFSKAEILDLGDLMRRESSLSISPRWIEEELIRRGYSVE